MNRLLLMILLLLGCCAVCAAPGRVVLGNERTEAYYPALRDKRVALLGNHTSLVGNRHLLDVLLEDRINVVAAFSPEHGFRGSADAGEHVGNGVDAVTGIPILSLYNGKEKKPRREDMRKFDVLLVDIQDVGLRFYTYYITMYRMMDACAQEGKQVILLDRPNPNGHYVDGPVLDMKYKSGVGQLPVPIVHGMTLGELARMINGERWLPAGRVCDLTVVPCENYSHQTRYELPVAPSPNLPNMASVYLYPSTCLFEGTVMSLGRGTEWPFQVYGHPDMKGCDFSFTPRSVPGAKNPPFKDKLCYGKDLRTLEAGQLENMRVDLSYVIDAYRNLDMGEAFFTPFFELLVGVGYVRKMIVAGCSAAEIAGKWEKDVEAFKQRRKAYLLYAE